MKRRLSRLLASIKRQLANQTWRKGATALLGFLAAAAIENWIADDYADRIQERELEATLLTTISRGMCDLYGDAQQLRATTMPQGDKEQANRRLLSRWLGASTDALAGGNNTYLKPLGLYLPQAPESLGNDIDSAEPKLDGDNGISWPGRCDDHAATNSAGGMPPSHSCTGEGAATSGRWR